MEHEALAMVFALLKFKNDLLGNKFVFYVDHMALVYLVNKPQVSSCILLDDYFCFWSMNL
jgi:hypothetical protein